MLSNHTPLQWRAIIGGLSPADGYRGEVEQQRFLPYGVHLHVTRTSAPRGEITVETVIQMAEDKDLEAGARLLAFVPLDCIAYLCTAASFIRGPGGDEEIVGRLQVAAGVPATTTSTAMLKAFRAMGIGRVAVVAPYPKPVTERLVDFLERSAVKVVQWDTIECKLAAQRSAITPGDVYRLVRKNDHPDAEAIFISCTGMPTSYVLDVLEQDLGKPVLSANQVTIWHSLLLSKVRAPMDGLGKLLSMFPSCK